jgi:hypothetical protein
MWWLLGGLSLGAVIPFTLIAIMPTNRRLHSASANEPDETRKLLSRWIRLHSVRSMLGVVAIVIFLAASQD